LIQSRVSVKTDKQINEPVYLHGLEEDEDEDD